MLLTSKEQNCSLTTIASLSFALSSLGLFMCSWSISNGNLGFLQLFLTTSVILLSTSEIRENNHRLLNGLSLLIVALPLVFYLLLTIFTLLSSNLY